MLRAQCSFHAFHRSVVARLFMGSFSADRASILTPGRYPCDVSLGAVDTGASVATRVRLCTGEFSFQDIWFLFSVSSQS